MAGFLGYRGFEPGLVTASWWRNDQTCCCNSGYTTTQDESQAMTRHTQTCSLRMLRFTCRLAVVYVCVAFLHRVKDEGVQCYHSKQRNELKQHSHDERIRVSETRVPVKFVLFYMCLVWRPKGSKCCLDFFANGGFVSYGRQFCGSQC